MSTLGTAVDLLTETVHALKDTDTVAFFSYSHDGEVDALPTVDFAAAIS